MRGETQEMMAVGSTGYTHGMRHALLCVALLLATLLGGPALAGDDQIAERNRLREEMVDLAQRNAWKGVDRMYVKIVEDELGAEPGDHLMGAQASTNLGEILVAIDRLEAAVKIELPAEGADEDQVKAHGQAKAKLDDIFKRYGRVEIKVGNTRLPGLVRFDLPFGTEERETIQVAREKILEERTYKGLLPVGDYMIDGEKFQVAASQSWQTIQVQ